MSSYVLTSVTVKEVTTDCQTTSKITEDFNSSLGDGRPGKQECDYGIYDQHYKTLNFLDLSVGITFVAVSFIYILYMNFH